MSQGTLTLTNNSIAVSGSGTAFTADIKPNDFIAVVVGGVTYTLGVLTVSDNTSIVLNTAYTGPTTANTAWTAIPNAALVGITASLAADVSRAIRGLNIDKNNWQQVFSGAENIAVNQPDGSTFYGPSWGYLSTALAGKIDKTGGNITGDLYLIRNNVPTTGGNGNILANALVDSSGTVHSQIHRFLERTQNNDVYYHQRMWNVSSYKDWYYNFSTGGAWAPGAWNNNSDARIKDKIERISDPLTKMKLIKGCTWERIDDGMKGIKGIGFIAQDVQRVFPDAVHATFTGAVKVDGIDVENPLGLSAGDVAAALHHEAILELMKKIEIMQAQIDELKAK